MNTDRSVRVFTMPQQLPKGCGTSCCCRPVGQTEEEIRSLKGVLEEKTGLSVAVINVAAGGDVASDGEIQRILESFGLGVLPIIALDDDLVCIGSSSPEQAALAVRDKMNQSSQ